VLRNPWRRNGQLIKKRRERWTVWPGLSSSNPGWPVTEMPLTP
jgi:hypothetical protein